MDYYKIGQRIRKIRKIQGISQEELAEKVGISVTHMSHIETGNTKMSLSVFAALAHELNVKADELLYDDLNKVRDLNTNEILEILNVSTTQEICILTDILRATKKSLEKYCK